MMTVMSCRQTTIKAAHASNCGADHLPDTEFSSLSAGLSIFRVKAVGSVGYARFDLIL